MTRVNKYHDDGVHVQKHLALEHNRYGVLLHTISILIEILFNYYGYQDSLDIVRGLLHGLY